MDCADVCHWVPFPGTAEGPSEQVTEAVQLNTCINLLYIAEHVLFAVHVDIMLLYTFFTCTSCIVMMISTTDVCTMGVYNYG